MIEETFVYYYMRGGKEFITASLNVAIVRRDENTVIYADDGSGRKPIKLE
jgi:hypothetical protein